MSKPIKPKTHYEQVPLEIVKKIAGEKALVGETNRTSKTVKPPEKE